jgi:hypothetical protein
MIRILMAGLVLAGSAAAWAGLDDAPTREDGVAVQTSQGSTATGVAYTIEHRTLRSGVAVDEFVDGTGKVFAVKWSGPFKPNLRELLGRHFDAYRQHRAGAGRRGGPNSRVSVDTGEAVVLSDGHMGAFQGRAWLPSRLPAGFDTQEMK